MKQLNWLISGCSKGIGKEIAFTALKNKDLVFATARNKKDLEELKNTFPENCIALEMDINDYDQVNRCIDFIKEKYGRIDVLVNNAGYGLQGICEELKIGELRDQMETNFFGLVHLSQKVIPIMRENKSGYIFNISSIAGIKGMATLGAYNASKFAVNGFSEAMYHELAPFNVRVSIVCPGPYKTDWAGPSLKRTSSLAELNNHSPYFEVNKKYKEFFDQRSGNQPGDPRQIANVIFEATREEKIPLYMIFGDIAMKTWEDRKSRLNDETFIKQYPHEQVHF